MGKDKRGWRKLVKKLRRQRKRQREAKLRTEGASEIAEEDSCDEEEDTGGVDEEEVDFDSPFFLTRLEWEYRERQAELECAMKRAEEEHLAQVEAEKQVRKGAKEKNDYRKIREEWEAKQEQEMKLKEEKERLEKLMKEKQEAEFNEFLSFLSGDIETPPTKYLMPEMVGEVSDMCHYFGRTAACRFYDRCTKLHPRPTLSTAILIPNFFSHFKLDQSVRDEYDSDIGLEYEDTELYKEFLNFYDDVLPEFRKFGTVIQFKVCCNLEPHLRGNVYIQYETLKESVEAFRKFNGRFYNGKQLSLQFIKMDSWRSAICGAFLRKACIKGRTCNYLHVFRNPTKEFVKADHDWKEFQRNVHVPLADSSSKRSSNGNHKHILSQPTPIPTNLDGSTATISVDSLSASVRLEHVSANHRVPSPTTTHSKSEPELKPDGMNLNEPTRNRKDGSQNPISRSHSTSSRKRKKSKKEKKKKKRKKRKKDFH